MFLEDYILVYKLNIIAIVWINPASDDSCGIWKIGNNFLAIVILIIAQNLWYCWGNIKKQKNKEMSQYLRISAAFSEDQYCWPPTACNSAPGRSVALFWSLLNLHSCAQSQKPQTYT